MTITEAIIKKDLLDAYKDFLEGNHMATEVPAFIKESVAKYYAGESKAAVDALEIWSSGFFTGILWTTDCIKLEETNEGLMELKA